MRDVIAAVAGALVVGPLAGVLAWWRGRGRDHAEVVKLRAERDQLTGMAQRAHADAAAAITAAATTLLQPLQARIEQLERTLAAQRAELHQLRPLRGEVDRLRAENADLHAQLDGLRSDLDSRTKPS